MSYPQSRGGTLLAERVGSQPRLLLRPARAELPRVCGAALPVPLLWALVGTSCLPYVVPPAQLSAGAGPTNGSVSDSGVVEPNSTPAHYNLRAGVHPLGAVEELATRHLDVGVGYQLERSDPGSDGTKVLHGPYLELDSFVIPAAPRGASVRAGARVTADLLFANIDGDTELGRGAMLAALVEWVDYGIGEYEDSSEDTTNVGVRAGELSIGGFLGAVQRSIGSQSYWGGVVGISVRIPLLAGIICCSLPGDSGGGSSSGSSDDNSGSSDDSSGSRPERTPATPAPGRTPARPTR